MKAYIIEVGEYSSKEVVGVFLDKTEAEATIKQSEYEYTVQEQGRTGVYDRVVKKSSLGDDPRIEEFELGVFQKHGKQYQVQFFKSQPGHATVGEVCETEINRSYYDWWGFTWVGWARDAQHAAKIANEKFMQWKANGGQFPTEHEMDDQGRRKEYAVA